MALGSLSLIAGPEGLGKSTMAYWLTAEVTRGRLPGKHQGEPRAVLVCATEDSWSHTIVPRLIAAGADLQLVYRVEVVTTLGTHGTLSLPHDNNALAHAIEQTGAALVLLDPLMSRLSGSLDSHRDQEVRQALEPMVKVADDTGSTVIGLIHFNKSNSADPLTNVMASKAFTAVARSVSVVVKDADDETGTRRIFATPKNNLGRADLPLLGFTIVGHRIDTAEGDAWTGRLVWGENVAGQVGDHLGPQSTDNETRSLAAEARQWLTEYMVTQGGRAAVTDVYKAAKAAGIDDMRRLRAAKQKIGLSQESRGFPAEHFWVSPDSVASSPRGELPTSHTSHTGDSRALSVASLASVASPDGTPEELATQGEGSLLTLLNPCETCGQQAVTSPCSTCRRSA